MTKALHCLSLLILATVATSGCSSDTTKETGGPAAADSSASASVGCSTDPRVTPYVANVSAHDTSSRLVATIMNADPSPPVVGMNTWSLKLTLDGAPVTKEVTVSTLMPDHGHSSPDLPKITANADGTHTVSNLYLFMGGVWNVAFSTENLTTTFAFCVD